MDFTERTLVIVKPDAIMRGIVGKVFERLEKVGLKLVACRMVKPTKQVLEQHYADDKEWITKLGEKSIETYKGFGVDVKEVLGTNDPLKLGEDVRKKLIQYMLIAPVILTVWEGVGAVNTVRKLVGGTTPVSADVGSLRGDLSYDSQLSAPLKNRAMMTIVHASGNKEEACKEIKLWFGDKYKPFEYDRVDAIFF